MPNASPTTKIIPSFDPFDVKDQLVELAQDYFNLDEIDTYESGFMGYLIQALTYLTSDVLYQNAFAYNEAFLNRALLRSSVTNIATQLDYKIKSATPASGNLTIAVPINMESTYGTSIKISAGTNISAGSIPYKVYNTYYIKQNSTGLHVTSYNPDTGIVEAIPYNIEMYDGQVTVVFGIQIWQINIYTYDFSFENPTLYQFYKTSFTGFEGEVYKVLVEVEEEKYMEVKSIYQSGFDSREYEMDIMSIEDNEYKITLKFGNGIYGYQPKNGAEGRVTIYTTLGSKGNISSGVARFDERLINTLDPSEGELDVLSNNSLAIQNGRDAETLEEIKRHTIESISSAKRLVTEEDYKGYAGVTGLTNIIALPMLNRRDVVGNDITIYNALYDDDYKLVPTASIPVRMDSSNSYIAKGSELIGFDGYSYCCPFDIVYDDSYDVPTTQYIYNLASTRIAPILFTDTTPEDVEMAVRMLQARIYQNREQIGYTVEIVKLESMNPANISAKLFINDNEEALDMTFTQQYNNDTVVNMSSTLLPYNHLPTGSFNWRVDLYYTYPNTEDPVYYATYNGKFNLFEEGKLVDDSSVTERTQAEATESYITVPTVDFVFEDNKDYGRFIIPILLTETTDMYGNEIDHSTFKVQCFVGETEYKMSLNGINKDDGKYTYASDRIPIKDIAIGEFETVFKVYMKDENEEFITPNNIYTANFTIMQKGKRILDSISDSAVDDHTEPKIELIHLGLTSIAIASPDNGENYEFTCNINKLPQNAASNITVNLTMTTNSYDMTQDREYYMEYTGDIIEATDEEGKAKSSVCVFVSPKIKASNIPTGQVTFKITLKYKGVNITTYKQSCIFKQDISRIIRSDVHKFSDGLCYACNVPVILKEWYDKNLDYLDQEILSRFLYLSENFNTYGMLTDRINVKFVRTCGKSVNMRLNNYMPNPVKTYSDDFSIDLPAKIHVKLYVSEDIRIDINDLITEAKNIIYTFLQLKSGFNANIYRSELARYLHDSLEDIMFCEVVEPTDEIIYNFDIDKIPRSQYEVLYQYCPEYIWFDKDNITVDVKLM